MGQCLARQGGKAVLGVECDSYRVEQGNQRHFDITANQKSLHNPSSTELKEFQSFDKTGSQVVESTTETNAIVCNDCMGSKSIAYDNCLNKSSRYDYGCISGEGANKETLASSGCTVQLLSMDGLPSTQKPCGYQATGDSLLENCDNKCSKKFSTCLPDTMVLCPIEKPPQSTACFVTKQLSLSVTRECVHKLDQLVTNFLTPGTCS